MSTLAATNLKHASSASNNIVLTSGGDVGIGTSSPVGRLSVNLSDASGDVSAWDSTYATFGAAGSTTGKAVGVGFNATSNYGEIRSVEPGVAWRDLYIRGNNLNFYSSIAGASVLGMVLNTSGNVGIGTSSPASKLDVYAASGVQISASDGTVTQRVGYCGFGAAFSGTSSNHPYLLLTNDTERMRIDTSGNVGVGTSSPSYQLTIQGTGQETANLTDAGNKGGSLFLRATAVGAGSGGAVLFGTTFGNQTPFAAIKGFILNGTTNTVGDLTFSTRNDFADTSLTERFRIGYLGQLGIGGANYGTSGQVLTSNGSAAAPSWQSASSTGTLKNVQVFTSSGTYTRTSGVTTAVVVAVGGGGGGKGANGPTAGPGGNGGAGGTTSFGSHVSAAGGSGATTSTGAAGGTGGTGATIAIKGAPSPENAGGGQGGGTPVNNAAGVAGVRGGGGSGAYFLDGCFNLYVGGGGGQGETAIKYTTTVGATETITIGAGGTAGTSNASRAGGAGGAGYIIVYEYS